MVKLLVIDDIVPKSKIGYGYPRALNLYNTLASRNFKITFIPINAKDDNDSASNREFNKAIKIIPLVEKKEIFNWLEENIYEFDALFISRPKNLKYLLPFLKQLANRPKIVYDVEALNSLREISRLKLINSTNDDYELLIKEELELIDNADVLSCVSHYEMMLIQERLKKKAFFLSHYHKNRVTTNDFKSRNGLLFVGGFYSTPCPNIDALSYFLEYVFPIITNSININLTIVGYKAKYLNLSIPSKYLDNVTIINNAKSLYKYYNECKLTVIPTRIGAGISYKFTETLSYGTPTVTSRLIANQVISNNEFNGYDNPEDFANAVIKLYTDENSWLKNRENSLQIITNNYSKSVLTNEIDNLLEHLKIKSLNSI